MHDLNDDGAEGGPQEKVDPLEHLIEAGRIERLDSGRTRVVLRYPVQHGHETVTRLDLRRPRARDIEQFGADPTLREILGLIVRVSGMPRTVIGELDLEDLQVVQDVVGEATNAFPPTGGGL